MLHIFHFSKKALKDTLSIYVKFNCDTLSVELNPQWDIKDVKEFVAPQLGLHPNEVKIIFAGKELSDTTKIAVKVHCNRFSCRESFQNTQNNTNIFALLLYRNAILVNKAYYTQ